MLLMLTACSNTASEADVTDETVLTPPENTDTIVGTWSFEDYSIISNNYFYGDGKLVSILQDEEEDTWCVLAYWKEKDKEEDSYTISDKIVYEYDESSGEWINIDLEVGIKECSMTSKDTLSIEELLPNENTVTLEASREEKDIQIPSETEITLEINDFLIH